MIACCVLAGAAMGCVNKEQRPAGEPGSASESRPTGEPRAASEPRSTPEQPAEEEQRSADPRIRALVDQVIEAHGGRQALRRVTGYVAVGKLQAVQRRVLLKPTRWFTRPDGLLLELDYPGAPEWRLTLGERTWQGSSPGELTPSTGPVVSSTRLQTARFDLPLRLLERERELTMPAPDALGRPVLSLQLDEGLRTDYHIAPDTHLVVEITMSMQGSLAMVFSAEYSGFREVDGVMLAHREVTRAGEVVTSKVVIDRFTLNAPEVAGRVVAP